MYGLCIYDNMNRSEIYKHSYQISSRFRYAAKPHHNYSLFIIHYNLSQRGFGSAEEWQKSGWAWRLP